ncbi:kirola-like [Salvia miltiorrhiza]|uniref:kirola-like n=1 Tax=Salvia miltiorrhiza TaxID=226208 RepID=UPI0025AC5A5F|nr:kirola-like [Salvia miltiorrhiza]
MIQTITIKYCSNNTINADDYMNSYKYQVTKIDRIPEMANKVETLVASSPITCPADKFYNFFKFTMNDIVKIFPAAFTGVEIIEGEEGVAGSVKLWHYILGGIPLTAKVLTEAIDDGAKTIKFAVLEGDLLLLYKSFKATLSVSEGSVKWTFEYEKTTILSPPPELYVPLAVTLCTLVDAFLLIN